jgi:hypothetical protein
MLLAIYPGDEWDWSDRKGTVAAVRRQDSAPHVEFDRPGVDAIPGIAE